MQGRPPKVAFNLKQGDYVKVRLNSDGDWESGYVTHIDTPRQQIFVDSDGSEYQFSFNEVNKFIKK